MPLPLSGTELCYRATHSLQAFGTELAYAATREPYVHRSMAAMQVPDARYHPTKPAISPRSLLSPYAARWHPMQLHRIYIYELCR
eukprot:1445739-Rhodomonas_salina.2